MTMWPVEHFQRGQLVQALSNLDQAGAKVPAADYGVVFQPAGYHEEGTGPMVRWMSGGCCNIYDGDAMPVYTRTKAPMMPLVLHAIIEAHKDVEKSPDTSLSSEDAWRMGAGYVAEFTCRELFFLGLLERGEADHVFETTGGDKEDQQRWCEECKDDQGKDTT